MPKDGYAGSALAGTPGAPLGPRPAGAPLEQSAEAIRLLTDRKAHGKVVVVPGLAG
jgi:hypothetical protein